MKQAFGDTVRVHADGHVAVLTIDRPPHNHVSVELMGDLADALEAVDADRELRASVLQAEGRNFCAGADLISPGGVGASGTAGIRLLYNQAMRLFAAEKPLVAAVQGGAIGVADFRVASSDARFSANFVKLGFHPGLGMTCTMPRLIGPTRAQLMCLTGRRIKADEALCWGLVDEVVPAKKLRAAALALAAEIAENAPLALVAIRKSLRADLVAAVRLQNDLEFRQQEILFGTEDFREGIRAVTERRPGNFHGR